MINFSVYLNRHVFVMLLQHEVAHRKSVHEEIRFLSLLPFSCFVSFFFFFFFFDVLYVLAATIEFVCNECILHILLVRKPVRNNNKKKRKKE